MISRLYSAGQMFHDSVYQGSMYVEVSYTNRLTFDSAYTMMEPWAEAIEPPTVAVTSFSSNLFKEILQANKDCISGTLEVSAAGLARVIFTGPSYTSTYYLVQLQTA